MKTKSILPALLIMMSAVLVVASPGPEGHAHKEGGHAHVKKQAGPNGGRVVTTVTPNIEVVLTEDRKVKVHVLDKEGKVTEPGEFNVTAIGGSRTDPTRLKFAKEGVSLLSNASLPEGNSTPVVLMLKPTAESKTIFDRFYANMAKCGSCKFKEYACICGH